MFKKNHTFTVNEDLKELFPPDLPNEDSFMVCWFYSVMNKKTVHLDFIKTCRDA